MTLAKELKANIKEFGLTGNTLKLIAIISMTIDHAAWTGIKTYKEAETPTQIFLHIIGRLTAPIMMFFVSEGYHHTRDFSKYLQRMATLAAISHFAFCYFSQTSYNPLKNQLFNATSIAWSLMWGLIFLKVWDTEVLGDWLKVLITLAGCILTVTSDWSCAAPLGILLIGRSRGDFRKQMMWLMTITGLYGLAFYLFNNHIYGIIHLACWLAIPLLSLYNGERGEPKWFSNVFYLYYPLHMAVIGFISRMK